MNGILTHDAVFPTELSEDTERMEYLYAAFPGSSSLNPKEYQRKMHIWTQAVKRYSDVTTSSIITFNQIHAIKLNGKTSLALPTVWQQMTISGKLVQLSDVKDRLTQSWTRWGLSSAGSLLLKPLSWATASLFRSENESWKSQKFVNVDVLESKIGTLVEVLKRKLNNGLDAVLIPYFDLAELCVDLFPSEEEFELALLVLQSRNHLAIYPMEDGSKIIKFTRNPTWRAPKVSTSELAKINLEKTLKVLRDDIKRLENRLEDTTREAIQHGKNNDKRKAYRALKRKHIMEKDLDQKHAMELNLEGMLAKLEDSSSLNLVISAMRTSNAALKGANVSLGDLDNTLDEVHEAMDLDQKFFDTMAISSNNMMERAGIYQDDLEAELEELANEDSPARTGQRNGVSPRLPDVSGLPDLDAPRSSRDRSPIRSPLRRATQPSAY